MLEYLLNCLNFFKVLGYFKGRVGVGKRESENGKMDVGVGKLDMLVSENEHVDVSKRACRPTRASKFRVLQPHGAEPLAASPLPFELGLDLRGCCHHGNGSSHPGTLATSQDQMDQMLLSHTHFTHFSFSPKDFESGCGI